MSLSHRLRACASADRPKAKWALGIDRRTAGRQESRRIIGVQRRVAVPTRAAASLRRRGQRRGAARADQVRLHLHRVSLKRLK
jgi:hypothetical protein